MLMAAAADNDPDAEVDLYGSNHQFHLDVTVKWTRSLTMEFPEYWNGSWGTADSDGPIVLNITDQPGSAPVRQEDYKVRLTIVAIVYFVTSVFGVVGNTLVVVVILRFPKIRNKSVSNYYILNLAVADLLHLLTLPFFGHATLTSDWVFGGVVCRLAHVLRECNKFASVFTLVALSIDRCLATYHHLGHLRRIVVGITVCTVIWIVCLAGCTPYLVHSQVKVLETGRHSCQFRWNVLQTIPARRLWIYVQLVFGLAIPFAVIASFNLLLLLRLRSITLRRSSMDQSGVQSRSHSGMARLVIVIVSIFMVSQLPYHVIEVTALKTYEEFVMTQKVPSAQTKVIFIYANAVAQVLVYLSSCSNPIVYGVINKNYRRLYCQVLGCDRHRRNEVSLKTPASLKNRLLESRQKQLENKRLGQRSPLPEGNGAVGITTMSSLGPDLIMTNNRSR